MDFTDWLEYEYNQPIEDDYDYYLAQDCYIDWLNKTTNLFFVGLNPRWQQYRFLPQDINVMFSAAGFWDRSTWRRGKFFKISGLTFLDSGGFSLLNQYGRYPFSIVNFANLVAQMKPHFYATMDYPCEPEISRSLGLMTNKERIEKTVENAMALTEYEDQLSGQMIPVIQGYTLDEYISCLELYAKAKTIRDYMAVGSMCRRINTAELNELIPGIYYAARRFGVKRLHYFGLKLSLDLLPLARYIYSRDSAVALDSYDKAARALREGRRWPRGQDEKRQAFTSFLERLTKLNLQYQRRLI